MCYCGAAKAQNVGRVEAYSTQLEMAGGLYSTSSHLAKYTVITGPKVAELQRSKSVYEHLPIEAKPIEPYAYGWFGAQPNPTWSRQFGYGRRHTQWSLK